MKLGVELGHVPPGCLGQVGEDDEEGRVDGVELEVSCGLGEELGDLLVASWVYTGLQ
eukprot:CAMPEP_0118921388 /NCGR_PEP_ID=MMETSP1169-20130426/694_1 /TAXON_ID=36882 /ORGANISM="Pyramimonas obovata, Strain CCMP722" /LENGTH=56 /DNA_ID=CAMNT_0006862103 /DNA_START=411 /DNA_END=581 /DNA_ORIENTATION=+